MKRQKTQNEIALESIARGLEFPGNKFRKKRIRVTPRTLIRDLERGDLQGRTANDMLEKAIELGGVGLPMIAWHRYPKTRALYNLYIAGKGAHHDPGRAEVLRAGLARFDNGKKYR